MNDKKVVVQNSFPILGILGLIFVTLKLTNFIDWSWWWVTLPFWGGFAFLLSVGLFSGLFVLLFYLFNKK